MLLEWERYGGGGQVALDCTNVTALQKHVRYNIFGSKFQGKLKQCLVRQLQYNERTGATYDFVLRRK